MGAGKKTEAMAVLRKAKHAEAQYENALATHSALERQIDVLAESALQREVATALSASVSVAKRKTLGLLSRTEAAVDSAVELKDLAEGVSQTFCGLQSDVYDEDELIEELNALAEMEDEAIEESMPAPAPVLASAPSKRLERASLLADSDGAMEGHVESM